MGILARIAKSLSKTEKRSFVKDKAIDISIRLNNLLLDLKKQRGFRPSGLRELDEVRRKSLERTVVNDHLLTFFIESLVAEPRLIVELGVEAGSSTFVFERVARLCGAKLVSLDFHDCSDVCQWKDWLFVQADDLEFAAGFKSWCEEKGIQPSIDILLIDTDHRYEQTIREITLWFPYLSERAKVFFHDSNLKDVFKRKDGSLGRARDYKRGVMKAIEEYLGGSFDESDDFISYCNGWLIKHHANCNGLTIIQRTGTLPNPDYS